nr:type II toxin-antitoxin system RelE/ParE family toxin [Pseudogemmobacter hezensis]
MRPAAREDLAQIWQQGAATWGADRADAYLDSLFGVFDLLAGFPEMARLRPEFRPPLRIHPSGRHLILYLGAEQADAPGIEILRLLHDRQSLLAYLSAG